MSWREESLRFKCTGCGKCCSGSPGYVWVDETEMQSLADFLKISLKEFMRKYTRRIGSRYSLVELKENYACIFLKENRCSVYEARPTQCRTYPWWPQNLSSKEAWERAKEQCEGINDAAPLVPEETIRENKLIQIQRNQSR